MMMQSAKKTKRDCCVTPTRIVCVSTEKERDSHPQQQLMTHHGEGSHAIATTNNNNKQLSINNSTLSTVHLYYIVLNIIYFTYK